MNSEHDKSQRRSPGVVDLVGAGPGDPGLITVKAMQALQAADVVIYDRLANPQLLGQVRADAILIDAGKLPDRHKLSQDQINALLVEHALAGRRVVRLKGGDPYVFGRGSEEAIHLHDHGIPTRIIPGITAGIAGPAYAGIPVTHRNIATTVTFITGHEDPTKDETQTDYAALTAVAKAGGTLCFYMAVGRLGIIVEQLISHGLDAATPAAIVQWATLSEQRSARAALEHLPAEAESQEIGSPAIVVVGQVAALPEEALSFFTQRPLFGKTIAITRTRQQASALKQQLESLGARTIEAPTIAIEPPDDAERLGNRKALENLHDYDWLVLTSVNGVVALCETLRELGRDVRHLAGVKVAAVGPATAAALHEHLRILADFMPDEYLTEALGQQMCAEHLTTGQRVLMWRADIARKALVQILSDHGVTVEDRPAYRTTRAPALPHELIEALKAGRVDYITFTSSSTVQNFFEMLGEHSEISPDILASVHLASIGPITTQTLERFGHRPAVEADSYDIPGLVDAIVRHAGR